MSKEQMKGVRAIRLATKQIELSPGQILYRTQRAWEIWQGDPNARRIKRIPRVAVLGFFRGDGEKER